MSILTENLDSLGINDLLATTNKRQELRLSENVSEPNTPLKS